MDEFTPPSGRSSGTRQASRLALATRDAIGTFARAQQTYAQAKQTYEQRHQAHQRWTDAEIEILRTNYETMPAWRVGELLGRSARAVVNKAAELGERRMPADSLSLTDIAALVGRDRRTVREWITSGRLKATRARTKLDADERAWRVTRAELRTFVGRHPSFVDGKRADLAWLMPIVAGALDKGAAS